MQPSVPATFYEVLVIFIVVSALSFWIPSIKGLLEILLAIYVLIERPLRKRSWEEIGFKFRSVGRDLLANGWLILLVGVGMQILPILVAKAFLPGFLVHIQERLPSGLQSGWLMTFGLLMLATLIEELVFRALFQARLSTRIGVPPAIGLVSLVFAGMHWYAGDPLIVFTDLVLVFVDSVIYGAIFARSRNVLASWVAHLLADVVAISLMAALLG